MMNNIEKSVVSYGDTENIKKSKDDVQITEKLTQAVHWAW